MILDRTTDGHGAIRSLFDRPYAVLALLFLIYVFNAMDRQIIGILAEPIRKDLGLNDTQLGLLTGLMFALFYTACGIPMGWLADRVGRVLVIACACTLWSVCSMAGAASASFAHLAALRVGVAVGEAGGTAPSYSMIAALFPLAKRAKALALFHLGSPIAVFFGAAVAGWVAATYGWRTALFVVSMPGLLLAPALFLLVREPARPAEAATTPLISQSFRDFLGHPVLRLHFLFAGFTAFAMQAQQGWAPAFLMRVKGMSLLDLSRYYSLVSLVAMGGGLLIGGLLTDYLGRRSKRAYALVPAAGLAIAMPLMLAAILADGWRMSLMLFTVPMFCSAFFLPSAVALSQLYAKPRQETVFGSIYLIANNLVAGGLGPLYVGMISDYFTPTHGTGALTFGMLGLLPVMALAIIGQLLIARAIGREV